MIITKLIEINGKTFKKTYSSLGHYILKCGTNEKYYQAIDLPESPYTYEETEEMAPEAKERDKMTLTGSDVERALYKAKKMDFEDLKALIVEKIPDIDIKALGIEFRANLFYRGATYEGIRLFDTIGALLGYSSEDIDYLFENKELPSKE